jgi:hypothetical protein
MNNEKIATDIESDSTAESTIHGVSGTTHDLGSLPFPHAKTTSVVALSYKGDLIIFVSGFVSGAGGRIVVRALPIMINPPEFAALAIPGNTGVTGHGLDNIPASGAYSFSGRGGLQEIRFADADGYRTIGVTKVTPAEESLPVDNVDHEPSPGEWLATQDFRTTPPTLRVKGNPLMPTPGYILRLLKADPQGIVAENLLLNLEKEPPSEPVPDVLTPTRVEYSEQGDQEYNSVKIQPDGPDIPVKKLY